MAPQGPRGIVMLGVKPSPAEQKKPRMESEIFCFLTANRLRIHTNKGLLIRAHSRFRVVREIVFLVWAAVSHRGKAIAKENV
jgi:hypothetical protein